MTLYVKGTDTEIVGTLENISGVAYANGLDDDGSIIWGGETKIDWNSQITELRNGKPVWISEDGGEYAIDAIEDRRDDGTVIAYRPLVGDPVRPMTSHILALWRHAVANFQTRESARDWADAMTTAEWLGANGLQLIERRPDIRPDEPGSLQITAPFEPFEDEDPRHGFPSIIGDDIDVMMLEVIRRLHEAGWVAE